MNLTIDFFYGKLAINCVNKVIMKRLENYFSQIYNISPVTDDYSWYFAISTNRLLIEHVKK